MKKKGLIERIAEKAGVPKSASSRSTSKSSQEALTQALKAGEEVQITGFGKFSVRERKAKGGHQPPDRSEDEDRGLRRFLPSAQATPSRRRSKRFR